MDPPKGYNFWGEIVPRYKIMSLSIKYVSV